jgi:hypothetical protein
MLILTRQVISFLLYKTLAGAFQVIRVGILDKPSNLIFFGAAGANLVQIPRNYANNLGPNFPFTSFVIGAGEIRAIAIDHVRNTTVVGTGN